MPCSIANSARHFTTLPWWIEFWFSPLVLALKLSLKKKSGSQTGGVCTLRQARLIFEISFVHPAFITKLIPRWHVDTAEVATNNAFSNLGTAQRRLGGQQITTFQDVAPGSSMPLSWFLTTSYHQNWHRKMEKVTMCINFRCITI